MDKHTDSAENLQVVLGSEISKKFVEIAFDLGVVLEACITSVLVV